MKTILLLISAVILLPRIATTASAQQEVEVRALSLEPGFPGEIHAHMPSGAATAGPLRVKSFLNHEGDILKFSGRQLTFTLKSDPSTATDINQRLATVDLPENLTSVILLFVPESAEAANFKSRVIVIDDSQLSFPPGSFKVANVTSVPIKIILDKKEFTCEPGATMIPSDVPYGADQSVGMLAYFKQGEQWKPATTGSWMNPGTRRVLEVFTEDPQTKEIRLRGIRDVAAH